MTVPPMHQWATDLFPIHRSLTGEGVRQTLAYLQRLLPELKVHEVPSGTKAFDWVVPKEWVIREAYIGKVPLHSSNLRGGALPKNRVVDIKDSNLHVLQYSTPVTATMNREQLDGRLHSLPDQPDAIPYVTSYYKEQWGFCLSQRQRDALGSGTYFVKIDSELKDGHLTYGELVIPGKESTEVLLSTNVCHPSMGNNELSGPCVVTALAQWLASEPRRHTYHILFLPETIGALVWLSRRQRDWDRAQGRASFVNEVYYPAVPEIIAGYQVVCCGDERTYSFMPSRKGDTLADRAALAAFDALGIESRGRLEYSMQPKSVIRWSYALDRGSDERQWCAPGIDLPVASIMRSKYDAYPEYHTSLDDLSFISQKGMEGSLEVYKHALDIIEVNRTYKATTFGEPMLSKYGLYPESTTDKLKVLSVLAYADGTKDLIDIAETIGCSFGEAAEIALKLKQHGLLE